MQFSAVKAGVQFVMPRNTHVLSCVDRGSCLKSQLRITRFMELRSVMLGASRAKICARAVRS
jgi:hypothetical protein